MPISIVNYPMETKTLEIPRLYFNVGIWTNSRRFDTNIWPKWNKKCHHVSGAAARGSTPDRRCFRGAAECSKYPNLANQAAQGPKIDEVSIAWLAAARERVGVVVHNCSEG
jgi:hypothetical protein